MIGMNSTLPAAILSRLRAETRDQHDSIERTVLLMNDDLSSDDYRHRLEQFYGYYKPLEDRLFGADSPLTEWLFLEARKKVPLLEADLNALGCPDLAQLPLCRSLPALESRADYWGCMYVLEGATLGGVLISRHIAQKLGVTPLSAGQFFNGYGARTGAMWQEFRNVLSARAFDQIDQDAIVQSARATFETLEYWCEARDKSRYPVALEQQHR